MKILLDMNLSPLWVDHLGAAGVESVHWSQVGAPDASDAVLMDWARAHDFVVFTNDLDFSALLALTQQSRPSVLQLRSQQLLPAEIGTLVLEVLDQCRGVLLDGALVSVDRATARVRVLPLARAVDDTEG